jgi:TonB family protein
VRYLENELHKRSQLGKAASIAGISLGIASTFAACSTPKYSTHNQNNVSTTEEVLSAEMFTSDRFFGGIGSSPDYPGGMEALYKFLQENMVYPKEAKENKIEGKVYVEFIVEKDGSISNITVARGIGGGCDEEAVRVVSMMPNWKPGKENGKEAATKYILPIHFKLDDK